MTTTRCQILVEAPRPPFYFGPAPDDASLSMGIRDEIVSGIKSELIKRIGRNATFEVRDRYVSTFQFLVEVYIASPPNRRWDPWDVFGDIVNELREWGYKCVIRHYDTDMAESSGLSYAIPPPMFGYKGPFK